MKNYYKLHSTLNINLIYRLSYYVFCNSEKMLKHHEMPLILLFNILVHIVQLRAYHTYCAKSH